MFFESIEHYAVCKLLVHFLKHNFMTASCKSSRMLEVAVLKQDLGDLPSLKKA